MASWTTEDSHDNKLKSIAKVLSEYYISASYLSFNKSWQPNWTK